MEGWLSKEQYQNQMQADEHGHKTAAPCPSDFDEGRSYWIEEYPIDFEEACQRTPIPTEADIVIIGSGITAAACLYNLAANDDNEKLRIAVLEARGICTGATGRNGGHICRAEGTGLRELVEKVGHDEAIPLSHLGTRNRDLMLAAISKLGIAEKVDLQLTGTRVVFASEEERLTYLQELAFAKEIDETYEARVLDSEDLQKTCIISSALAKHGADCIDKSGTIYPRKLVAALFRHAMQRLPNLTVHAHTPVRAVTQTATPPAPSSHSYTVQTDHTTISTRAVLHATNAYASYLIPSLTGIEGVLGCKAECVAIQPPSHITPSSTNVNNNLPTTPPSLLGGLGYHEFWHYLIQRPNNGPLIYGWAGAEKVGDYDDSKHIQMSPTDPEGSAGKQQMQDFLNNAFPSLFPEGVDWEKHTKYRWSGIQGFTKTGASLVGRAGKERLGEFVSVGHNGEGMGRCFACATVVTERMLWWLHGEKEDEWCAPEWFPRTFLYNI